MCLAKLASRGRYCYTIIQPTPPKKSMTKGVPLFLATKTWEKFFKKSSQSRKFIWVHSKFSLILKSGKEISGPLIYVFKTTFKSLITLRVTQHYI